MDNIKTIEGDLQCRELRFAIVAARFNDFIVEQLIRGAVDALKRHGAADKQIEIVRAARTTCRSSRASWRRAGSTMPSSRSVP